MIRKYLIFSTTGNKKDFLQEFSCYWMRSSSLSALFHVDVEQLSVVTADEITLLFEVWWMLRSWLMVVNCSMFSWELGRVPGFIHLSYDRLSPSIYPLEHCEAKMKIDKQCCLHQFLSGELRVGFIGILSFSSSSHSWVESLAFAQLLRATGRDSGQFSIKIW